MGRQNRAVQREIVRDRLYYAVDYVSSNVFVDEQKEELKKNNMMAELWINCENSSHSSAFSRREK